jgi:hypothetical protein
MIKPFTNIRPRIIKRLGFGAWDLGFTKMVTNGITKIQ